MIRIHSTDPLILAHDHFIKQAHTVILELFASPKRLLKSGTGQSAVLMTSPVHVLIGQPQL